MPENPAVPVGLKLNDLAKFEVGVGVVLLAVKDAGKNSRELTYSDLYEVVRIHLKPRLERYQIANTDLIVQQLLTYLRDYQSVFTISAH